MIVTSYPWHLIKVSIHLSFEKPDFNTHLYEHKNEKPFHNDTYITGIYKKGNSNQTKTITVFHYRYRE